MKDSNNNLRIYSPETLAKEDFTKVFNFSQRTGKKMAVLSIDIQRSMFKWIFQKNKVENDFIKYCNRIHKLSSNTNTPFFDIKFEGWGGSLFEEELENKFKTNVKSIIKKDNSAFKNTKLLNYLQSNKIEVIFIFGLFRNKCILSTILDLKKFMPNAVIVTCFRGSKSRKDEMAVYERDEEGLKKSIIKPQANQSFTDFDNAQFHNGNLNYSYGNFVKFLKDSDVLILDHYYKGKDGKMTSDLAEFGSQK